MGRLGSQVQRLIAGLLGGFRQQGASLKSSEGKGKKTMRPPWYRSRVRKGNVRQKKKGRKEATLEWPARF